MFRPSDKIYIPEGSYREMTEWVLPADQLTEYARVRRSSSTTRVGRNWPASCAAAFGETSR